MIRKQRLPNVAVDRRRAQQMGPDCHVWRCCELLPAWCLATSQDLCKRNPTAYKLSSSESTTPVYCGLGLCSVLEGGVIWLLSKAESVLLPVRIQAGMLEMMLR